MLKPLLTNSTTIFLLLAASLSVRAEAPQPEPQIPQQFTHTSQSHPLVPYAATDSVPTLKSGSQGQAVVDVQRFLQRAGLYTGAIDGIFGPESQRAVLRFQQRANLATDGVIGINTWRAMLSTSIS